MSQFQYHEKGVRTKEEKQAFIIELSRKLNERFSNETGHWDEGRTGTFVRNLKKTRLPSPTKTPSTVVKSPMEQLLFDWQVVLQTSSRLNANNLARHPSDRGSCNEDLIKGFLSSVLSSRYIGIGSGEIFTSGRKKTRQLDIVLYSPDYPCLRPARFGGNSSDGCCCFYEESVMLVIEVKTTLTNQDLADVGLAASTENHSNDTAEQLAASTEMINLLRTHQLQKSVSRLDDKGDRHGESIAWLWTEQTGGQVSRKHLEATYRITAYSAETSNIGTAIGVTWRGHRFLLTCEHVIRGSQRVIIRDANGHSLELPTSAFALHQRGAQIDLAVVKDPSGLPFAHFEVFADFPKLGQNLHVLGYPLDYDGLQAMYTSCTFSGERNRGTPAQPVRHYLLTGGAVNPGNSGGPLIVRSPTDNKVWLTGVIARAPDRFPPTLQPHLSAFMQSQDPVQRIVGQMFYFTSFVGTYEVVAAEHVRELLAQLADLE